MILQWRQSLNRENGLQELSFRLEVHWKWTGTEKSGCGRTSCHVRHQMSRLRYAALDMTHVEHPTILFFMPPTSPDGSASRNDILMVIVVTEYYSEAVGAGVFSISDSMGANQSGRGFGFWRLRSKL